MTSKSFLRFLFLSGWIASAGSSCLIAMDSDEQLGELSGTSTSKKKPLESKGALERDIGTLLEIVNRQDGSPFYPDDAYEKLGDSLIEFARSHRDTNNGDSIDHVVSLYQKDKDDHQLTLPRITWLAVQLSMALSPRATSKQRIVTSSSKLIEQLEKKYKNSPLWLLDMPTLEEYENQTRDYLFLLVKTCHSLFTPLAVYESSGTFSLKDYFGAMRSGVFLYGFDPLQGLGHTVHGGIYKSGAEKTLHDLTHYYQQWLENYRDLIVDEGLRSQYQKYSQVYKRIAQKVYETLEDDEILSDSDKSKLEVLCFLMMHEVTTSIPAIFRDFTFESRCLTDVMHLLSNTLKKNLISQLSLPDERTGFYQAWVKGYIEKNLPDYEFHFLVEVRDDQLEKYKTNITFIAKSKKDSRSEIKMEIWVNGFGNYEYWKSFYRDIGHMLIERKLWTPKNTKLGTTYEIVKVKNTLEQLQKWFVKAIGPQGSLYKVFDEPLAK